jgi:hypothetical protein
MNWKSVTIGAIVGAAVAASVQEMRIRKHDAAALTLLTQVVQNAPKITAYMPYAPVNGKYTRERAVLVAGDVTEGRLGDYKPVVLWDKQVTPRSREEILADSTANYAVIEARSCKVTQFY